MAAKEKYPLQGIIVSLNTPFDDANRIDFASLHRLVDYHLQQGAVGFLTPAQAGEVLELTLPERIELVQAVRRQTAGKVHLIAGATATDESESRTLAQAAVAAGCEGVLIELPNKARPRSEIISFCERFAGLGMPMLMLQDLDWSGPGAEVWVISELFERIPSFRCLKVEVAPAGPKYSAVLEATKGRLHLSGGWAAEQMLEALDRGADAFIPTAMTGQYRRIFEAHRNGDMRTARELFYKILPVLAFTRQHLEISIHFYKRLYQHLGIFATAHTRKNKVPYDRYHEKHGAALIEYLQRLELTG